MNKKILFLMGFIALLTVSFVVAALFAEDNDGGFAPFQVGTCYEHYWWGYNSWDDICVGRNNVLEYFPVQAGENFFCNSTTYVCPGTCSSGECI